MERIEVEVDDDDELASILSDLECRGYAWKLPGLSAKRVKEIGKRIHWIQHPRGIAAFSHDWHLCRPTMEAAALAYQGMVRRVKDEGRVAVVKLIHRGSLVVEYDGDGFEWVRRPTAKAKGKARDRK